MTRLSRGFGGAGRAARRGNCRREQGDALEQLRRRMRQGAQPARAGEQLRDP